MVPLLLHGLQLLAIERYVYQSPFIFLSAEFTVGF